ncbi:MAG: hypothetical protein IKD07_06680 [Clostridia bacterium]|nr:hypothetical protein [Clostridia bacterium]
MKAVKFGGTSLSHAKQMQKAAEIVRSDTERRIITVSAPGKRFPQDEKITDLLYRMDEAQTQEKREEIFSVIRGRLDTMISELGLPLDFSEEYEEILQGVRGDALIGKGEYFCARIFAALIGYPVTDAADVIFLDETGEPDLPRIKKAVGNVMKEKRKTVIPGFYGRKPNGALALLPRGGSDITGALAAYGADAEIYENFTDVNGFLLADPRIVPKPETAKELSYGELRRLSSMGACVLHADSVLPLKETGIPVWIRNTNDPHGAYTRIGAKKSHPSYSGIVGQKGYLLFSVAMREIGNNLSDFQELLRFFGRYTKRVYSTPHAVDAVGILVSRDELNIDQKTLVQEICERFAPEAVSVTERIALLSLIGEGMAADGTGELLNAMKRLGAEPILLDGGADSLGVTVGFHESYLLPMIETVYQSIVSRGAPA